jgi:NTP pyrophosphatase (non-canonical NTP hydrolase)
LGQIYLCAGNGLYFVFLAEDYEFDHLHEELIEMSSRLRYRSEEERKRIIVDEKEMFVDGVGDLFFGLCRLANQLGVDVEEAFDAARKEIFARYDGRDGEEKRSKN